MIKSIVNFLFSRYLLLVLALGFSAFSAIGVGVGIGMFLGHIGTPWVLMYVGACACATFGTWMGLSHIERHERTKCEEPAHCGIITPMSDWVGYQPTPNSGSDFCVSESPTQDIEVGQ